MTLVKKDAVVKFLLSVEYFDASHGCVAIVGV